MTFAGPYRGCTVLLHRVHERNLSDRLLSRLVRVMHGDRIRRVRWCALQKIGPKGPRATNLAFLQKVLNSAQFRSGQYDTGLVDTLSRA